MSPSEECDEARMGAEIIRRASSGYEYPVHWVIREIICKDKVSYVLEEISRI